MKLTQEEILKEISGKRLLSAEEYYKFLLVESWHLCHSFLAEGQKEVLLNLIANGFDPETAQKLYIELYRSYVLQFLLRLTPHIGIENYQKLKKKLKEAKTIEEISEVLVSLNILLNQLGLIKVEIRKPQIEEIKSYFEKIFK